MKEIKILLQQLRSYPDNFFVCPRVEVTIEATFEETYPIVDKDMPQGLIVCDMDGIQQGFIETGGKEGVVIQ